MRILEEFWYGNIEPTEYDTSSCKEYKKLLELICRNKPTVEDFKKTVSDYLAWEVSTLLKNQPSENERLGK